MHFVRSGDPVFVANIIIFQNAGNNIYEAKNVTFSQIYVLEILVFRQNVPASPLLKDVKVVNAISFDEDKLILAHHISLEQGANPSHERV